MSRHPTASEDGQGAGTEAAWSPVTTLRPVPPFDFGQSLAFLRQFSPTRREQAVDEHLTKTWLFQGQAVAVRITSAGPTEAPALVLSGRTDGPLTSTLRAAISDRIGFYLSLADDVCPFYDIGQRDPAIAPVIRLLYGYHQVKFSTPFESAAWAILSQRTPIAVAQRAKQALAATFGQSITVDGSDHWPFPEPGALASASSADIAPLVHQERKASYLHAAAVAFAAVDESFLRHGPFAEVQAWLRNISGIGPWSASFILIRGLGRMDETPMETELEQAATLRYGPISPAVLTATAQRYGPWQGYWAHYLRVAGDRPSPPAGEAQP